MTDILCPRCQGRKKINDYTDNEPCFRCEGAGRIPAPDISHEDTQVLLAVLSHFRPDLVDEMFTDTVIKMMDNCPSSFTPRDEVVLHCLQCVLLDLLDMAYDDLPEIGEASDKHTLREMSDSSEKKKLLKYGRRGRRSGDTIPVFCSSGMTYLRRPF